MLRSFSQCLASAFSKGKYYHFIVVNDKINMDKIMSL